MRIQIFNSIEKIPESQWRSITPASFPFADYQYLRALEITRCLGDRTGWLPFYISVWQGDLLLGAIVTYAKTNSYGEYIFDFAWAQAYESYGLEYYPKLTSAIPFTPATGPKILFSQSLESSKKEEMANLLLTAARELGTQMQMSSVHSLFIPEIEIPLFQKSGFFIRESYQYHWKNQNYQSFEDFLSQLRSKRRKEILRERSQAQSSGLKIFKLTGSELKEEHAEAMHLFYSSTVGKMGGFEYLTPDFFQTVFEKLSHQILLVLAQKTDGEFVAGALNYFGNSTLFGRNWGSLEEYRALHFELCYYQGIEFAIERKLSLFEAGAQGEHKFQRGFLPNRTYSAHWIQNADLSLAIEDFVRREKMQIKRLFAQYEKQTPFSREEKGEISTEN